MCIRDRLIVGQNYSPRIIDDFTDQLKARAKTGKTTRIIIVDPDSNAFRFLQSEEQGTSDHMAANSKKIVSAIDGINQNIAREGGLPIEVVKSKRFLRYSFVYTERSVWIKPYRNSAGRTSVYALEIEKGGQLYEFYDRDIRDLLKESGSNGT